VRTIFLDAEATGLRGIYAGGKDEIVELAILDNRGRPVINQLVHPTHRKTWLQAQRIHGISPAMVADAPTLEALLPKVSEAVKDCRVVMYNSAFCLQFLPKHIFLESWVDCAMLQYAGWKGEWNLVGGDHRWHKLHVAAEETGFNEDVQAHRALADTMACRHVWRYLVRGRQPIPPVTANDHAG